MLPKGHRQLLVSNDGASGQRVSPQTTIFQEVLLKIQKFPAFPEGISNSRRSPVFPEPVDTMLNKPRALNVE